VAAAPAPIAAPAVSRPPPDTLFVVLTALLILAMQAFSERPTISPTQGLGWPMVNSGDEPHYLILLNSVLLDGDLDLKNNYFAMHLGADQGGKKFIGSGLDHHASWYLDGERKIWSELFISNISAWPRGPKGELIQMLRPGVPQEIADGPEYSAHPIGIALLLAPLLFVFRGTSMLEPAAVICAGLATVLAMALFRRWLWRFTQDTQTIRVTTLAVFLASPVWYYSRGFFNEPFLVLTVIGSFAFALEPKRSWASGAFLGAGMLMKPQLALVGLPIGLWFLWKKQWRDAVLFGLVPTLVVVLILILNKKMYGSYGRGPYPFYQGDFWVGFEGLWTQENRGLLYFFPACVFAVLGWPLLLKKAKWEALFPLVGFVLVLGLTSIWKYWDGGLCYGPRLLVPVIPLLGLGLVAVLDSKWLGSFAPRWWLYLAIIAGILGNGLGTTRYWGAANAAPSQYVPAILSAPLAPR
jgi:hypothetical protein